MGKLSKLFKLGSLLFVLGMLGLIIGFKKCQQSSGNDISIKPISNELDVPFKEYQINIDSISTIETETGSLLTFEPSSFVTKKGAPVNGMATIRVRELHDAVRILRSGIPMRLRSDRNKFLISAGMLEVRALQGTEELELKDGKSIFTELAAYRSSKDYQLFYLKDNTSWTTLDTFVSKPNERKKTKLAFLLNKIKHQSSIQPIHDDIIFQLFGDQDEAPELSAWRGLNWKIDKRQVNDQVLEALHINWDSVKVKIVVGSKKAFELEFTKTMQQAEGKPPVTKRFRIPAKPFNAITSDSETLVDVKKRLQKQDSIRHEVELEISRVNKEADLVNSFQINRMGIWNIDKASSLAEFVNVSAKFDFQSTLGNFQKVRVFCVMKDDNSVLEYTNWQKERIYLSKTRPMELIAVLDKDTLAFVDFNQIKNAVENNPKSIFLTTNTQLISNYISYK